MQEHVHKQHQKSQPISLKKSPRRSSTPLILDNRRSSITQAKLQQSADASPSVKQLQAIQEMVNSRATIHQMSSKEAVVQRVTVALRHPEDQKFQEIIEDAQRLHAAVKPPTAEAQQAGGPDPSLVVHQPGESKEELFQRIATLPREVLQELHIVTHGNSEDVGGFDIAGLAAEINKVRQTLGGDPSVFQNIRLHSCDSAKPHPRSGVVFAEQLASRVQPPPDRKGKWTTVTGMTGRAFTDIDGQSRVLAGSETPGRDEAVIDAEEQKYSELHRRAHRNLTLAMDGKTKGGMKVSEARGVVEEHEKSGLLPVDRSVVRYGPFGEMG